MNFTLEARYCIGIGASLECVLKCVRAHLSLYEYLCISHNETFLKFCVGPLVVAEGFQVDPKDLDAVLAR